MKCNTAHRRSIVAAVGLAAVLFASARLPAQAGGGHVLPPTARPHGYSLTAMAAASASFNTGIRLPLTEPNTPFQVLYIPFDGVNFGPVLPFVVPAGTMLYVPLVYDDEAVAVNAAQLPDVNNPTDVAFYWFSPTRIGTTKAQVSVDGVRTLLGPGYAVGAGPFSPPLPDGSTHYTVIAAFLTPLSKGIHTVMITWEADGPNSVPSPPVSFEQPFIVIVQ